MKDFEYAEDIMTKIAPEYPDPTHQDLILESLNQLRNEYDLKTCRVERCVLFLARGDIDRFIKYSKSAFEDWRDVIIWAEDDDNGNRIYDFNKSFDENKI